MPGVTVDEIFQPRSKFDLVLEGLIYALLIFSPLAMGVVEAWSEFVVICIGAAIALVLTAKFMFDRDAKPVWTWAYVPLGLFILFAVIQIIPMPSNWIALISPNTVALKKELIGDIDPLHTTTISFYPHATKHDLRLLLVFAAVFAASAHAFHTRAAVTRLLTVVSSLGVLLAIVAIAQIATGTDKIFWVIEKSTDGVATGGPFVNRNNFCMWMNASLGCTLSLLLLRVGDGLSGLSRTVPAVWDWLLSSRARHVWLLAGGTLAQAAAVFLSMSRGGVLALLVTGSALTLYLAIRRKLTGPAWLLTALTIPAFACILALGFDAIYDRLSTLAVDTPYLGRWDIAKGALAAWAQYPLVGTGLGSHEVVFPMYGSVMSPRVFAHAENEYAQLAEETGLIGLLATALFLIAIGRACLHNLRLPGTTSLLAYGAAFATASVLVQSVADFGLHLPAIHGLMAALAGTLIATRHSDQVAGNPLGPTPRRRLAMTMTPLTLLAFAPSLIAANTQRLAECYSNEAQADEEWLRENNWVGPNSRYSDLIRAARAAKDYAPDDVHRSYWLAVYRWRALRIPSGSDESRGAFPSEPIVRIVADLREAQRLCPTFGPAHSVAGQIAHHILADPAGAESIERALTLSPFDPTVCFAAGTLAWTQGAPSVGRKRLARAISLDHRIYADVLEFAAQHGAFELARRLAGNDIQRLLDLETSLFRFEGQAAHALNLSDTLVALLTKACESPNVQPKLLVRLANHHLRADDPQSARRLLERAVRLAFDRVDWHLLLARTCSRLGDFDAARRHAGVCTRLSPGWQPAIRLLSELGRPNG